MTVALVGIGNLGSALIRSLLASSYSIKSVSLESVLLIERDKDKRAELSRQHGCRVEGHFPDGMVLGAGDVLILTVKPQDAETACIQVKSAISQQAVVISCMAGVSCASLSRLLDNEKIVRAMPNLGAAFRESASAVFIPDTLTAEEFRHVSAIINACGKVWHVAHEDLIDVATAVAGSGPAYMCWLAEQLEMVAIESGIPAGDAHALVLQTFKGAVSYLEGTAETFSELRRRVTSPNGTTAAALSVLEERAAAGHIRDAVRAALSRARELNS